MRAALRWAHADLRAHRGEALFLVLATAGVVASLLLAAALFGHATNPWQRVFGQARGAHVWLHTGAEADTGALRELDGVESVAGPYPTADTTVTTTRGTRAAVELRGTPGLPAVGRPLLTSGTWLDPGDPGGVVLENRLAAALLVQPGDALELPDASAPLTVVGVAESPEPRYRAGERPGLVWALPADVPRPDGQAVGLRLTEPDDTGYAVQRAVTALGSGAIERVTTWQEARGEAQVDNRLLGQVLGLFGLGALLAAGLAVHGAIGTRVRGHLRDIPVLKAIGFTPGQVVGVFLFQHLAYAVLGAVLGATLVQALGGLVPGRLGEAVGVWQGLVGHTATLFAVPVGVVVFIGATTGLAAWRAGRVPAVPRARPAVAGGNGLSGLARGALGLRMRGVPRLRVPAAAVLGWHAAFRRGGRTAATIGRLSLPLLLIVVALGAWTTIDAFHRHPEEVGLAAALTVRADPAMGDADARARIEGDPDVVAAHPGVEMAALVPGQTATIALRGLGTRADPYPYAVVEGRAARGPDEAVAGQGLLDLLRVDVGDWVRMTVGDRPQILHIVGRAIEPENAGRVVSTSLDTLRQNDPALRPTLYRVRLAPDADPERVAERIARAGGGRMDAHTVDNPADGLSPLREVVLGLTTVLALIGLIDLLTTIGGTVREGERDLPALKAAGLSPRQVASVAVIATGLTALAAVILALVLGLPLSHWLIDGQGASSGIGSGIARGPSPALALALGGGAVLGAVILAVLPASRAVRRRLGDTLDSVA
ncbi:MULTISPECIES: ABC transporter permease [unclassified Streptomyces]|uniref:ABC transporter permease n=1 Tax=unclassified Streptomyces TaxID=2593676 RepID=UPI0019057726|nr:ABC transporter permease [Streptomyces sp. HSG2]